jgi:hypothetical protein
MLQSEKER